MNLHVDDSTYSETPLSHYTPEHSLLTAIVYRSVLDYLNDTQIDYIKSAKAAARSWFWPFDNNSNAPFSFNWVAEHLSSNPGEFKETIRRYLLSAPTRMDVREKFGKFGRRSPISLAEDWRVAL